MTIYTQPRDKYFCSRCEQVKPVSAFGAMKAKGHLRPVQYACKQCRAAYERKRWHANSILNSLGK